VINGHGDDFSGTLKANFSSNVWYGADNSALFAHLNQSFTLLARYPEVDAKTVKSLFAKRELVEEENVVVCNGSVEAFYLIAQSFAGSRSLIVAPTFSEYADACELYQHRIKKVPRESLSRELETRKPDLCWICNPNNPDGFCYSSSELLNLVERFPSTTFIIDQAYWQFAQKEPIPTNKVLEYPNLILIHSLTKRYAIPGLRIGFLYASADIVVGINSFKQPWSVSTLALEAAKFIVSSNNQEFPLNEWIGVKDAFQKALAELDVFEIYPSQTPFFLAKLRIGKASELKSFLLERGLLIRDATNFDLLDGEFLRLNTLDKASNNLLINALHQWKLSIAPLSLSL